MWQGCVVGVAGVWQYLDFRGLKLLSVDSSLHVSDLGGQL